MTQVIAEAGVNHNGQEELAAELVVAASQAGADYVKFQIFSAENLAAVSAKTADYQAKALGFTNISQLEMLKALELSPKAFVKISEFCQTSKIKFLASAFDRNSLRFLLDELGADVVKIASGEIDNAPFLLEHATAGVRIIMSTGMSSALEVKNALGVLAFGMVAGADEKPSAEAFIEAYASKEGRSALEKTVTLLHCTSEYPAPMSDVNMHAMVAMGQAFELPVGYSDHTDGLTASIAAAALGAQVIEKHLTLDKRMEGPDHKASLAPDEFRHLVNAIRETKLALGDSAKEARESEIKNRALVRKGLYASKSISVGEKFSNNNLIIMRPATGMSPFNYWSLLGQKASKFYEAGDVISE